MKLSRRLWTSTCVFPSPCCKYSWCKKPERCNFLVLTQIRPRCNCFHISINTVSCLLAEGAWCHMGYHVRRCYGHGHTKEVRGDGLDLLLLYFIIKTLMDHSRKSLQSFKLLLLDVNLDILGTSTAHLYLTAAPGEPKVGYVQHLLSTARVCRLPFPLLLNLGLKSMVLQPWAGSTGHKTSLYEQDILVMMAVMETGSTALPPPALCIMILRPRWQWVFPPMQMLEVQTPVMPSAWVTPGCLGLFIPTLFLMLLYYMQR